MVGDGRLESMVTANEKSRLAGSGAHKMQMAGWSGVPTEFLRMICPLERTSAPFYEPVSGPLTLPMLGGGFSRRPVDTRQNVCWKSGTGFSNALTETIINGIGGRLAMLQPVPDSGGLTAVGFSRSVLFARLAGADEA